MEDILIMGIETSCDETSVAIVRNGREILSNTISSQIEIHSEYGGVVPEIASRKHVESIIPVIRKSLKEAELKLSDIDVFGVTYGPGLVGALIVGVAAAKSLAFSMDKPLVGVHHIEGHIAANYIEQKTLEPPYICLVVSGGHSHIVYVKDYTEFEVLGRTRDDAAGEAYDKVARTLGLGYPGGPAVDKAAREGNISAVNFPRVKFKDSLDFSFSGIKTAVLNYINNTKAKNEEINVADVCASFQDAVVGVLVDNTITAAKEKRLNKISMAGGVSANSYLREKMAVRCMKEGIELVFPTPILCTDNGAMIASAAYFNYLKGKRSGLDLNAVPSLALGK